MIHDSANLAGTVLGTCTLKRLLGRGGMSVVYLAEQLHPTRYVALKILLPNVPMSSRSHQEFLARFRYEADIIARLEHVNIIPIYEYNEQDGLAYLVMPYLSGGSLSNILAQRRRLSLEETAIYIEQAAAALDYTHAYGVIHRDLKPSNFLLYSDGRLVLADFGIARIMQESSRTITSFTNPSMLLGTPYYMSPEMIRGEHIDYHSDIYELGIVLFQLLSGDVPFKGSDPYTVLFKHLEEMPPQLHQLDSTIPSLVDDVIQKATAKRPGDRFVSAGELAQALNLAITTMPQYDFKANSYNAPTLPFQTSSPTTPAIIPKTELAMPSRSVDNPAPVPKTGVFRPRGSPKFLSPVFFYETPALV